MSSKKKTKSSSSCPLAQKLLFASAKGNLQKVLELLQQGATVAVNKHGRTALHISSHRGFLDIVRVLLRAGCNPDIQDDNGDTALHRAVSAGNDRVVQRLLDEACDIDRQNKLGDTALHEASRCGFGNIVKLLLQSNANVYCKNKNQDIPLHMSCANGHSSSTQMLLLASSPASSPNHQGDTPLHLCVRYGHTTSTKLLIAAKCNLNSQNEFGNTALHIAATSRQSKLVRILLDANANATDVRNKDGKTSVDLAKDMGNGELVIMLISGPRLKLKRRHSSRKSSSRRRSNSEPRVNCRRKNSSEECNADVAVRRQSDRVHTKRSSMRRNSMLRASKPAKQAIEDHQKNLVVNPYVVPQLYSLYRDERGSIQQVPVLDHLPNPTPQIVNQLHHSIEEANNGWQQSLQQITLSFNQKLDELRSETDVRLKAMDKLSLERIHAEESSCRQRIGQRMACERFYAEDKVKGDLETWIDHRLQRAPPSPNSRPYRFSPMDKYPDIPTIRAPSVPPPHHNGEVEVRSVDSGVCGSYTVKDSTPAQNQGKNQPQNAGVPHKSVPSPNTHPPQVSVGEGARLYGQEGKSHFPPTPWHSTPYDLHHTVSYFPHANSKPPQTCMGRFGNPLISASCDHLSTLPYYTSSDEVLGGKSFECDLKRQAVSYDCNIDTDVISRLQNLSFGEVHAV